MRRIAAGGLVLLTAACSQSAPVADDRTSADAAATNGPVRRFADCAWLVRSDPVLVNVLYPDKDAVYYIAALPALPGVDAQIVGEFPHGRYMSFVAYDGLPIDAIADQDIVPDTGHGNPFIVGADRTSLQRNYTVRLVASAPPEDAAQREPGVLYIGAGQLGVPSPVVYAFYRIYVPDEGTGLTGGEALPRVQVAGVSGESGFVPVSCETVRDTLPALGGYHEDYANTGGTPATPVPLPGAKPVPAWSVESGLTAGALGGTPLDGAVTGGPGSNPHSKYLAAAVSRAHGDLVVVRAKAPTAPRTKHGEPVMTAGDLRYWSICQNSRTTRFIDCLSDSDIAVDADGTFTLVISTPEARPASARNWIPFGAEPEGQLLYRHMLPDAEFLPHSAQGWVEGGDATLEQHMGPYYPHAVYCTTADFEADACE